MAVTEEDLGVPIPVGPPGTARTYFGRRKTFAGLHLIEWLFLVVSIGNIFVSVSLTIYSLVRLIREQPESPDVTLTLLLLINAVFCLFYVINGLFREKEFEIYALMAAISFVLTYCILEYVILSSKRTDVKLARLIVACILAPVNIALAFLVAREFGWLEFKVVGASEALQHMYREASRFTSLLKFDFQVMVSFVILVLLNGLSIEGDYEKAVLGVGLPLSLLWCVLGWISMRRELTWGMVTFGAVGLLAPSYVFYVMYRVNQRFHSKDLDNAAKVLIYATIAAAAIGLLVRLLVYISGWRVFRKFDQGLRECAFETEANERTSLLTPPRRT